MAQNLPRMGERVRPVILVVDDDPGLRESFRVILEDGHELLDVPDGFQALEVLRSCQVDLVLLDIRLPGMDGMEVLDRIKTVDEHVEVILVTAVKDVRHRALTSVLTVMTYALALGNQHLELMPPLTRPDRKSRRMCGWGAPR